MRKKRSTLRKKYIVYVNYTDNHTTINFANVSFGTALCIIAANPYQLFSQQNITLFKVEIQLYAIIQNSY